MSGLAPAEEACVSYATVIQELPAAPGRLRSPPLNRSIWRPASVGSTEAANEVVARFGAIDV
jgi:hypothetical protein